MFDLKSCSRQSKKEKGSVIAILLWLIVLVVCLVILPFFVFGKIVTPNHIGVRQNYYSIFGLLKKGYDSRGLAPGLQWKIPGLSTILLIPRDFQLVHLNDAQERGELNLPSLNIPTTDGSKVKTDMTLVYRFFNDAREESPQQVAVKQKELEPVPLEEAQKKAVVPLHHFADLPHGGPRELLMALTDSQQRQLNTLAKTTEDQLKQHLSALSTTEFYNPILREQAALNATAAVNKQISISGVELWGTLIRRYIYAEKNIDDQIFAKNLQDQTERLNAALSRLAEAKAETERNSALWDAKIRNLEVKGETDVQVARSEGNLYEAEKVAEGDLLVASAKAEVDGAKAGALASLSGADTYIAREMTPLLHTLSGGIVSDVDPYDIRKWVRRLMGRE